MCNLDRSFDRRYFRVILVQAQIADQGRRGDPRRARAQRNAYGADNPSAGGVQVPRERTARSMAGRMRAPSTPASRFEPHSIVSGRSVTSRIVTFGIEKIAQILSLLEFESKIDKQKSEIVVTAPDHRTDISGPHDLIEEIARMLTGAEITETARRHARELLKS